MSVTENTEPQPPEEVKEEIAPVQETPPETNNQEIPKSAEDIAFDEMAAGLGEIREQRDAVIQALIQAVKTTKLDPQNEAPRVTEVKIAMINALDSVLKSQESLHLSKAKAVLNRKAESDSSAVKQMAIEVLRNINMNNTSPGKKVAISDADQTVLNAAFAVAKETDPEFEIKDDELIMDK